MNHIIEFTRGGIIDLLDRQKVALEDAPKAALGANRVRRESVSVKPAKVSVAKVVKAAKSKQTATETA